MNFKPKASVAQILYGDVAEAKVSGFMGRLLTLKYRSGKRESFNYVESPEFKKLKALLSALPKGDRPSEVSGRHHLCPRCNARLFAEKYTLAKLPVAVQRRRAGDQVVDLISGRRIFLYQASSLGNR
jgi:hypothetical protein